MSADLTLAEFLTARLDELQQREQLTDPVLCECGHAQLLHPERACVAGRCGCRAWRPEEPWPDARQPDPFVLADVAAKRTLLLHYEATLNPVLATQTTTPDIWKGFGNGIRLAVQLAAAAHAEHPDYREEWAP